MTSSPARLQKVEEKSAMMIIDEFLMRYAHILLPIFIVVLLFFIIALVIVVADISSAQNISMVESGTYYNHLKNVI